MLIDTHIHFDDPRFDPDRDALYQRALDVGIAAMVLPAVTAATWDRTKACVENYPRLYSAYGLHPYFIGEHREADLLSLSDWIEKESPVAVGECGLDYYLKDLDRNRQQEFFCAQLDVAKRFDLPVIVHVRSAVEDVIHFIKRSGHHKGVVHSYNGSMQQAKQLIDLGFYLAFGGAVTNQRAKKLRHLVRELPLDSLLLETDAPDQPGAEHKGQINEPAWILEVLRTFVDLRQESLDEVAYQTTANACALFGIKIDY